MGLRDRIMGWLDRGDGPDLDPDQPVELEDVSLHEGPLLLSYLEGEGISAQGFESYPPGTEGTAALRMRILVHRRDAARASQVLEDYYRHLRDTP